MEKNIQDSKKILLDKDYYISESSDWVSNRKLNQLLENEVVMMEALQRSNKCQEEMLKKLDYLYNCEYMRTGKL